MSPVFKRPFRMLIGMPARVLAMVALVFGGSSTDAKADARFADVPSAEALQISDKLTRMADRYLAVHNTEAANKTYRFAHAARIANDATIASLIADAAIRQQTASDIPAPQSTTRHLSLVAQNAPSPATQVRFGTHGSDRYVAYPNEVHVNGSRAWRNNNPGNIKAGSFASSHGSIGSDGTFAIFPSLDAGRAAQEALIENRYANQTIDQMIRRYAPASENNTENYIKFVRDSTGIDSSTLVSSLNTSQLQSVIDAMDKIEGALLVGTVYRIGDAENPSWVNDLMQSTES